MTFSRLCVSSYSLVECDGSYSTELQSDTAQRTGVLWDSVLQPWKRTDISIYTGINSAVSSGCNVAVFGRRTACLTHGVEAALHYFFWLAITAPTLTVRILPRHATAWPTYNFKLETAGSSEALLITFEAAWFYNPQILKSYPHVILKYYL
jgi:hypothetical protein